MMGLVGRSGAGRGGKHSGGRLGGVVGAVTAGRGVGAATVGGARSMVESCRGAGRAAGAEVRRRARNVASAARGRSAPDTRRIAADMGMGFGLGLGAGVLVGALARNGLAPRERWAPGPATRPDGAQAEQAPAARSGALSGDPDGAGRQGRTGR